MGLSGNNNTQQFLRNGGHRLFHVLSIAFGLSIYLLFATAFAQEVLFKPIASNPAPLAKTEEVKQDGSAATSKPLNIILLPTPSDNAKVAPKTVGKIESKPSVAPPAIGSNTAILPQETRIVTAQASSNNKATAKTKAQPISIDVQKNQLVNGSSPSMKMRIGETENAPSFLPSRKATIAEELSSTTNSPANENSKSNEADSSKFKMLIKGDAATSAKTPTKPNTTSPTSNNQPPVPPAPDEQTGSDNQIAPIQTPKIIVKDIPGVSPRVPATTKPLERKPTNSKVESTQIATPDAVNRIESKTDGEIKKANQSTESALQSKTLPDSKTETFKPLPMEILADKQSDRQTETPARATPPAIFNDGKNGQNRPPEQLSEPKKESLTATATTPETPKLLQSPEAPAKVEGKMPTQPPQFAPMASPPTGILLGGSSTAGSTVEGPTSTPSDANASTSPMLAPLAINQSNSQTSDTYLANPPLVSENATRAYPGRNPTPLIPGDQNYTPPNPRENVPYWMNDGKLAMKAPIEKAKVADLETMVWAAISHSPYVQAVLLTPTIKETEINQAKGAFDPTRFADSVWNDRSDPVGNTLTTGGPPRLNETLLDNKVGVKNKNQLGGNWEASQGMLMRDSNSRFFIPSQQADMKMLMRYTQPLMRGAGKVYNRATITIAELNTSAAGKDANQALQAHVMDLTESYWSLYLHRSQLLQVSRGINELNTIADNLRNRRDLDLVGNQLLRALAAVETLRSRHTRTNAQIIEDEENLRRLVNAPWIQRDECLELIPSSQPLTEPVEVSNAWEMALAMVNRPELLSIRDSIQAANVKQNVAKNDLRPTLNLVTDFYVRGLNGNYDVGNSFADQFSTGRPSYSGGVEYLRPKNQTVSKAIYRQRNLEIRQLLFKLDDQLLQVSKEVQTAIASVNASYAEWTASIGATLATKAEYEYLEARWQSGAFLDPTQVSLNLEQLLDAQQRLIQAESNWATSEAQYMIALARLQFATGTLLTFDQPIPE